MHEIHYMIASPPNQGFLCLRCQLKLVYRRSRRFQRSAFHSTQQLAHNVKPTATTTSGPERSWEDAPARRISPVYRPLQLRQRRQGAIEERAEPLPIPSLGQPSEVIILNDQDKRPPIPRYQGRINVSDVVTQHLGQRTSASDLIRSLEAEKLELSQAEANRLIEDVAGDLPIHVDVDSGHHQPLTIPKSRFDGIAKKLYDGFSRDQLWEYSRTKQNIEQLEHVIKSGVDADVPLQSAMGRSQTFSRMSRSIWKPGTSPIETRVPEMARTSYYHRRIKTKKDAVEQLLRATWNISIEEEVMSVGELELTLNTADLFILLSGEPSRLQLIATNHNATIDFYRPAQTLRVTANRATCLAVEAAIQAELFSISTEDVDLGPILRIVEKRGGNPDDEVFRPVDLEEIERITRTSLELVKSKKETVLRIRYQSQESADDARRLALALVNLRPREKDTLFASGSPQRAGILPPIWGLSDLPYRDRQRSLARWIARSDNSPAAEVSDVETMIDIKQDGDVGISEQLASLGLDEQSEQEMSLRVRLLDLLSTSLRQLPTAEKISETFQSGKRGSATLYSSLSYVPRVDLEVTLGYVLHEQVQGSKHSSSNVTLSDLSDPIRFSRTFSTVYPGLLQLLPNLQARFEGPTAMLLIRLKPPAWAADGIRDSDLFPDLELYCSLNHVKLQLRPKGMRFVYPPCMASVMLPSHAVDLRFVKKYSVWVKDAEDIPAVKNFIQQVGTSVAGVGVIRAPTFLKDIRVPVRKSSRPKSLKRQRKDRLTMPEEREENDVEEEEEKRSEWTFRVLDYTFAELEYSQQTQLEYKDFDLYYSNIQAGRMGGARGELKMRMPFPDQLIRKQPWQEELSLNPGADDNGGKSLETFIGTAFDLVHLMTEGVLGRQTGPRAKTSGKRSLTLGVEADVPAKTRITGRS